MYSEELNDTQSFLIDVITKDLKMSRCLRKMPHRKNYELESGKFTRKSVRLNNVKENLKTYPGW